MSCWSLGSISLRVGLPRAGEGSVVCWEGILQVRTRGPQLTKLNPEARRSSQLSPALLPRLTLMTSAGSPEVGLGQHSAHLVTWCHPYLFLWSGQPLWFEYSESSQADLRCHRDGDPTRLVQPVSKFPFTPQEPLV